MKKVLIITLFFLTGLSSRDVYGQTISGIINTYTSVTAINTACNAVTVSSTSGFSVNDRVLIIQMKEAATSMTQTNGATFGDMSTVGNAGNYEFAEIQAFSATGTTVYFKKTLARAYTPANLVQMIRVPGYTNVTISGVLTAQSWDGTTGGVLVFEASGTVTFSGNIDVNSLGFRGGVKSPNGGDCGFVQTFSPTTNYFYGSGSINGGGKGEGIAMFAAGMESGRGKQASGGGGGNNHNNGGGGGANFGSGGSGGNRASTCYNSAPTPYPNAPGVGGLALNTLYYTNALNKISPGAGGGGGQGNNSLARNGGNGGGIVIVRANTIDGGNYSIMSKGDSVGWNPVDNGDGNGGGGGGGTVLLDVQNFTSAINIDVRGGAGGYTNGGGYVDRYFGPGGGGGGGVVWIKNSNAFLTTNVTAGKGGITTGVSATVGIPYGATDGSIGNVIPGLVIPESSTPFPAPCVSLPVELLTYNVTLANARVKIAWSTASEKNSKEFIVERSLDLVKYETVKTVPSIGNSTSAADYEVYDIYPYSGTSYYRLRQIDIDGKDLTMGIRAINREEAGILKKIYPNPFADELILETLFSPSVNNIKLFSAQGIEIPIDGRIEGNAVYLNTTGLADGIYIVQISDGYSIASEKIIKFQK